MLRYQGRLCVQDVDNLRGQILEEYQGFLYFIHLGATKMYLDLQEVYWWDGLKRDKAKLCLGVQIANKLKSSTKGE